MQQGYPGNRNAQAFLPEEASWNLREYTPCHRACGADSEQRGRGKAPLALSSLPNTA